MAASISRVDCRWQRGVCVLFQVQCRCVPGPARSRHGPLRQLEVADATPSPPPPSPPSPDLCISACARLAQAMRVCRDGKRRVEGRRDGQLQDDRCHRLLPLHGPRGRPLRSLQRKGAPPPPPPFLPAWPCRCAFHRNLASVMACFVSDVTLALDNRCKACIVPCGALVRASCCVRLAVGSPAGSRAEWQTRATRCRSLDDACRCS